MVVFKTAIVLMMVLIGTNHPKIAVITSTIIIVMMNVTRVVYPPYFDKISNHIVSTLLLFVLGAFTAGCMEAFFGDTILTVSAGGTILCAVVLSHIIAPTIMFLFQGRFVTIVELLNELPCEMSLCQSMNPRYRSQVAPA